MESAEGGARPRESVPVEKRKLPTQAEYHANLPKKTTYRVPSSKHNGAAADSNAWVNFKDRGQLTLGFSVPQLILIKPLSEA